MKAADLRRVSHNPGLSPDWTPHEESALEDLREKYASESAPALYVRIAQDLRSKTVRHIASRIISMNKSENSKRKNEDIGPSRKNKGKKKKGSDADRVSNTDPPTSPNQTMAVTQPKPIEPIEQESEAGRAASEQQNKAVKTAGRPIRCNARIISNSKRCQWPCSGVRLNAINDPDVPIFRSNARAFDQIFNNNFSACKVLAASVPLVQN
ncbi:hypothetical protein AAHA92_21598 [Salvia divinorum]|uniref:Myb-like domain-containing protein n=1 Tax=Salvia divinorum TaxID=28513 RepID=A0ABD1GNT3_SALDI